MKEEGIVWVDLESAEVERKVKRKEIKREHLDKISSQELRAVKESWTHGENQRQEIIRRT